MAPPLHANLGQNFEAVHMRHGQAEQDKLPRCLRKPVESFTTIGSDFDSPSLLVENTSELLTGVRIVLDQERTA